MVRAVLQGPRERGGFFRDVRRWSRPREREGDLYRTCSARTKCACARLLLPILPLPTHLVKINNYDETYEAAECPADDPLGYVETGMRAGDTSFINCAIP